MKKIISNETRDEERAYYSSFNCVFENVKISGPADGESAFKECKDIETNNCVFDLRYPLWHVNGLEVKNSSFSVTCRAALWYTNDVKMSYCEMHGIKAFRECKNINVIESKIYSDEVFWRVSNIEIKNTLIEGVYAFFQCNNIDIDNVGFTGKYSFQYTENVEICDSTLNTKDAFWHSKNVTVRNSVINGEYLGWYSENLTLINCKISGTQPLCYAKGLKVIDCTMDDCDLAFEYSEVDGIIVGKVKSIKNPLKGKLIVEHCDEFIKDEHDRSNDLFELVEVN